MRGGRTVPVKVFPSAVSARLAQAITCHILLLAAMVNIQHQAVNRTPKLLNSVVKPVHDRWATLAV